MSIRTRVGKLERAAPIDPASLSVRFIAEPFGKVVAAELPELGLSRVNRLDDEAESDFRERVHLLLAKAHSGRPGPFYELLDTTTLEACLSANIAFISKHDPNALAKLKESGVLNV